MNKEIYQQEWQEWNLNALHYTQERALPFQEIIHQEIWQKSGLNPSFRKILDVGCGAGHLTAYLKIKTDSQIIGVDFSPEMIKNCQRQYPHIKFLKAGAEKLPFPEKSFDAVLCASLLHHLKPEGLLEPAAEEFYRVLKPNGILCAIDRQDTYLNRCLEKIYWIIKKFISLLKKNLSFSGTAHEAALSSRDISLFQKKGFLLIDQKPLCSFFYKNLGVIANFIWYLFGLRPAVFFQKLVFPLALFSEKYLNSNWFSTDQCLVFRKL